MNKANPIILYLIIFTICAIFLRISGLIDFTSLELLAYLFMISGTALSYISFGKDKKGLLFIGSTAFLIGIMVYVNIKFDLEDTRVLLFPSVLFIIGIGFLLLWLDERKDKIFAIISSVFLGGGILFMMFFRNIIFKGFLTSLWSLIEGYWLIIIIVTGLLLVLHKEN